MAAYEDKNTGIRKTSSSDPGGDWYELIKPNPTIWQAYNGKTVDDGNRTIIYTLVYRDLESAKQLGYSLAQLQREQAEYAGILWEQPSTSTFVYIATDEVSQGKVGGAYSKATHDPNFTVAAWKCKSQSGETAWLSLTNSDVLSLGDAVSDHVEDAFSTEKQLFDDITSSTTVSEIETLFS